VAVRWAIEASPDRENAEAGGLQNTVTSLGASLGTDLTGAVLISSLITGQAIFKWSA
jgi:hypothetical protein